MKAQKFLLMNCFGEILIATGACITATKCLAHTEFTTESITSGRLT